MAGICAACQNDVLKKTSHMYIKCQGCNATWVNKTGASCNDCVVEKLNHDYPNAIKCTTCNTKWYNNSLSQFGKNQRSYYASKYKAGRM